jgi:hypothetical protein
VCALVTRHADGNVKRRTLHGGFCVPGYGYESETPFLPHLSPKAQAAFTRWTDRYAQTLDDEEAALRAVLTGAPPAEFAKLVDALVPGRGLAARAHSTVLLSKAARRAFFFHHPELTASGEARAQAQDPPQEAHNTDKPLSTGPNGFLQPGPVLYGRFTAAEASELWARFRHVDAAMQQPAGRDLMWEPGFQGGLSNYNFHRMPPAEMLQPLLGDQAVGAATAAARL